MNIQAQAPDDYSGSLFLRCPKALPDIVRQAARGSMTSASAYVTGAILRQLRLDGFHPSSGET